MLEPNFETITPKCLKTTKKLKTGGWWQLYIYANVTTIAAESEPHLFGFRHKKSVRSQGMTQTWQKEKQTAIRLKEYQMISNTHLKDHVRSISDLFLSRTNLPSQICHKHLKIWQRRLYAVRTLTPEKSCIRKKSTKLAWIMDPGSTGRKGGVLYVKLSWSRDGSHSSKGMAICHRALSLFAASVVLSKHYKQEGSRTLNIPGCLTFTTCLSL